MYKHWYKGVADLNQRAIGLLPGLINFKTLVLDSMLCCRIFTFNYPLLIDHIRREAILFLELLKKTTKQGCYRYSQVCPGTGIFLEQNYG